MAQPALHIDENSFKKLFGDYRNRVYGYILTIAKSETAADELTQEVFLKIWLSRDLFPEVENLDGYIFAIAKNVTLRHLKKAASDANFLRELQGYMRNAEPVSNIDEKLATTDFEKLIGEALDQLTPQRRKVYELSRNQGMNMEQISQELNIAKNTVKNHLVDALSTIRNYLREHGADTLMLLLFLIR